MKVLACLFLLLGATCGAILPLRPNCANIVCTMDVKICPDGTLAPIPVGGCCPSLSACKPIAIASRNNPLSSLLSNTNILQTLTTATHGTNLGTVLSIMNLLNNVQQLTNDVHEIPHLINQTLATVLAGAGQAGQLVIDQIMGAISNAAHQKAAQRNILGALGQNTNLLSSITHLLPQGTSISTILSILNLLSNVNQLNQDIHQIPAVLNQTLNNIFAGAGQAGQLVIDQLLNLVNPHNPESRGLFDSLTQGASLISTITNLLPQGTSMSTILSIINLLNNVNQLAADIQQLPTMLTQALSNILAGTGQNVQNVVQQILNVVGINAPASNRGLLDSLTQTTSLISTITNLLPQGTSMSSILSIINLINSAAQSIAGLQQLPTMLTQALSTILAGTTQNIQNIAQQILTAVGINGPASSRGLFDTLTQSAGLISTISNLLPQGTSMSTILSIISLINSASQLASDIQQLPTLLYQGLSNILAGTGQNIQNIVQQILNFVGISGSASSRGLLDSLGQNANLLSTISHLLPQGTSISTILSLLNLLTNVNALNNDLHQIPGVLQATLQDVLNAIQNALPPTIQPIQGSA